MIRLVDDKLSADPDAPLLVTREGKCGECGTRVREPADLEYGARAARCGTCQEGLFAEARAAASRRSGGGQ